MIHLEPLSRRADAGVLQISLGLQPGVWTKNPEIQGAEQRMRAPVVVTGSYRLQD